MIILIPVSHLRLFKSIGTFDWLLIKHRYMLKSFKQICGSQFCAGESGLVSIKLKLRACLIMYILQILTHNEKYMPKWANLQFIG